MFFCHIGLEHIKDNLNIIEGITYSTGVTLADEKGKKEDEEQDPEDEKKEKMISSLLEGKRMEAYAEHRTEDMHHCFFCETITYKKVPGKRVGNKWICIDCLRKLKEILENLDEWEEEMALGSEMEEQLDEELGI